MLENTHSSFDRDAQKNQVLQKCTKSMQSKDIFAQSIRTFRHSFRQTLFGQPCIMCGPFTSACFRERVGETMVHPPGDLWG